MLDEKIQKAVDRWIADSAISEPDRNEIKNLLLKGEETELMDRFYRNLSFGTGGLRGVIGAGLNRMNVYTVGAAAQGLANYIKLQGEPAMAAGVAIAYDCRRMSPEFALRTALVIAGNGINAFLFPRLRPTPELSFAVRHLNCIAGVVVTASHNPPEYNGFKVYWRDGAQVVPPHDQGIIDEVRKVGGFANVKVEDESSARSNRRLRDIGPEIDEAYLEAVNADCLISEIAKSVGSDLKIIYSSIHGTGGELIPEALSRRGYQNVINVAEQAEPDGEFPTVKSPNPEEPAAWELPLAYAKKEEADIAIATDPDADRVGVAVRDSGGEFQLLTGNRIAALMTWFICEVRKANEQMPKRGVVLSTVVSSDQMKEIARGYGCEVIETLTGFKWIAEQIGEFEDDDRTFLFGAEESYGYLPSAVVRDKDAVASAAFIADAAAYARSKKKTLLDVLDDLYRQYGFFEESTKSVTLKGKAGADDIERIMAMFRLDPPKKVGGRSVEKIADLRTGEIRSAANGATVGQYNLPKADVIILTMEGAKLIVRPSGTEPKIKFYILVTGPGKDLEKARAEASELIGLIGADVDKRISELTAGKPA